MLIDEQTRTAVGLMGSKGGPRKQGDLEIGYRMNLECWGRGYATEGRGYATEALRVLLPHRQATRSVRRVTAKTARGDPASARVLEKCGFVRVGEGWSEDDGVLILWATAS